MDGKLILGFLNYMFLALIFIFGIVSLLVRNQRKKLTFLFLALFSSGVLSYLFFAGIAFMLPGIILIFFCLLLYIFIAGQEFYGYGKSAVPEESHNRQRKRFSLSLVINLVLSLILSMGAGAIFFIYTNGFFKDLLLVESFKVATAEDIINNMGAFYIPAALLISVALFTTVFWFISILENRRTKN